MSAITSPTQLQYHPHREPSYELAAVQSTKTAESVVAVLERSPRGPPPRLLQEAQRHAAYQRPKERLVGFVGNSGAGKSSTLNSLFDEDGLAKTGACGSAVTPFPAEYRYREPGQAAPFTLICRIMAGKELGKYLGDLLRDYWSTSPIGRMNHEEENSNSYEDTQAARDIFEATFGGIEGFDIDRLNYDENDKDGNTARRYLSELCNRLDFPENMTANGEWREESEDAAGCEDHQSLLQERGLWPLVMDFSIFADTDILKYGLTLVDLPGFNDTNLARIRAARKAQSKCDDICVVADIARVTDSQILQQNLQLIQAKAEGLKLTTVNITIICTKSAADLDRNKSVEKLVDRTQLNYARAELQKAKGASEQVKKHAERRLETLLITARNEKVEKDLQKKYGAYIKGGILKVFCVDNRMYWNATCDAERELSGIPALQQHLSGLPAASLFKETDLFLAKKIPALVSSFATWVESCRVDFELENRPKLPRAGDLRLCLDKVEEWATGMFRVFEKCFNARLKEFSTSIGAACLKVAQGWEKWPPGSVTCCVRHDGNYTKGTMGVRNWNKELLECFEDEVMGQSWHEFEVDTDPLLNGLWDIVAVFQGYAECCAGSRAPGNFLRSLAARQDILRSTFQAEIKLCLKGISLMRVHAIGTHQNSYIVDCMLETYRAANEPIGVGAVKARLAILQNWVSSKEFVEAFRAHLAEDFQDVIDDVSARIKAALEHEIEAIESDLEAIQPSKGNERLFKADPEYGQECEDVLSMVTKQLGEIDELAATARAMARERYG
ncbi:hypothetical protein AYO20_06164 [Fonsecaea nubica]|uniref:G domain-containing protein n=1 Tax=Fonsecaea nubica TaxID=856822 RepID=A0A178CZC7_9EURO|nr:hypothetical protein AYO20_06164 [Fonsecaea nubica]OAL34534.1 hypothetical protein AYO20_06164 [Fonsecaea nubica]